MMSIRFPPRALLFGEVLFDRFPDGREALGGAPFNVAWHLRGFGEQPLLISRVGEDDAGRRVREAMMAWGMDVRGLQVDPRHPTGVVRVDLEDGEPHFHILPDQAYDFITPDPLPPGILPALLYHGSLALRRAESRASLEALVSRLDIPVFLDVNLRPPWWDGAAVLGWARRAAWLKLNGAELDRLSPGEADMPARAGDLRRACGLKQVFVTLGGEGALAISAGAESPLAMPGIQAEVVDTVGAGDAFASVLMLGLLRGWRAEDMLRRASDFATAMVRRRGATVADRDFYRAFGSAWGVA